jgi:16S rRNA (uracil1498-N3)-methyltransferase
MHKFFVNKEDVYDGYAIIKGEDVKHIYKVLRLQAGEAVSINNLEGEEFSGEIDEVTKTEVKVRLTGKLEINNESPVDIYLYQGLPKSAKMDLIVQKATELGVKAITPVVTSRVIVKSELGEFKKTDRWKRIALEASKQSKRTVIPEVNVPLEFDELKQQLKKLDLIIVPYENEEMTGIKKVINNMEKNTVKTIGIVIGPEGGFEVEEIDALKEAGAHIVTLGPRILRTETAGLVAASILMYELGDIGGNI